MSLAKFMKYAISATFVILVYIHLQMQIVDLAYQGQRKEARINDLVDRNGTAFYAISRLKSANHLGGKLLAENSNMQFAGAGDIVYVAASGDLTGNNDWEQTKRPDILANLLSFATQAEARNRE